MLAAKRSAALTLPGGRGAVKQVQAHRVVLDAPAEHVDDAPFGDLPLQPVQKLGPPGAVPGQRQGLSRLGLGGLDKGRELGQVHGVVPVIFFTAARFITGLMYQGRDDEALQTFFAGASDCHHVILWPLDPAAGPVMENEYP